MLASIVWPSVVARVWLYSARAWRNVRAAEGRNAPLEVPNAAGIQTGNESQAGKSVHRNR